VKCDQCDNEATVHEVTVRNGVKIERHLCEQCAAKQGIAVNPDTPVAEIIKQFMQTQAAAAQQGVPTPVVRGQVCPACKLTFAEFKQHGLLGCPECYAAFEAQLSPLLERAHEGGVRHTGKTPRRMMGGGTKDEASQKRIVELEERAERLRRIRDELDNAVKAENYERAAKLRDEMRRLRDGGEAGETRNA